MIQLVAKQILIIVRSIFNKYIRMRLRIFRAIARRFGVWGFVKEITVQDKKIRALLPTNDIGLTNELLMGVMREKENVDYMIKFLQRFEDEIEVILDIGSNIGYFILFERLFLPNVKVLAFEPIPENYQVLRFNLFLNNFDLNNIEVRQAAVVEQARIVEMELPPQRNWARVIDKYNDTRLNKIVIKVSGISLKEIFSEIRGKNVFMRMDIEGYEYDLIKNASFLREWEKKIFMALEFHPHILQNKSIDFLKIIKDYGFQLDRVLISRPSIYLYFRPQTFLFRLHNWLYETIENEILQEVKQLSSLDDFIIHLRNRKNWRGYHLFLVKENLTSSQEKHYRQR